MKYKAKGLQTIYEDGFKDGAKHCRKKIIAKIKTLQSANTIQLPDRFMKNEVFEEIMDTLEIINQRRQKELEKNVPNLFNKGFKAGIAHHRKHIDEGIENRKLLFSEKSNMWYRKGTGALFTNSAEIAEIENKVLQDIKKLNENKH